MRERHPIDDKNNKSNIELNILNMLIKKKKKAFVYLCL